MRGLGHEAIFGLILVVTVLSVGVSLVGIGPSQQSSTQTYGTTYDICTRGFGPPSPSCVPKWTPNVVLENESGGWTYYYIFNASRGRNYTVIFAVTEPYAPAPVPLQLTRQVWRVLSGLDEPCGPDCGISVSAMSPMTPPANALVVVEVGLDASPGTYEALVCIAPVDAYCKGGYAFGFSIAGLH
jgi:hypothetical protein